MQNILIHAVLNTCLTLLLLLGFTNEWSARNAPRATQRVIVCFPPFRTAFVSLSRTFGFPLLGFTNECSARNAPRATHRVIVCFPRFAVHLFPSHAPLAFLI
jgi:hypothetical protein